MRIARSGRFVFVAQWGVLGLGLAYAVAYLISALWALKVLSYKVPGFPLREIASSGWRMLLAAALMAEAMWFVTHRVDTDHGWSGLAQLVVGGVVGLFVYGAVLVALRAPEVAAVRNLGRQAPNPA